MHPDFIGTAPSAGLLVTSNKQEGELIATHVIAAPLVGFPPEPIDAHVVLSKCFQMMCARRLRRKVLGSSLRAWWKLSPSTQEMRNQDTEGLAGHKQALIKFSPLHCVFIMIVFQYLGAKSSPCPHPLYLWNLSTCSPSPSVRSFNK
jgi:hypothetical protein